MKILHTILFLLLAVVAIAQPPNRMSLHFLQASPEPTDSFFLVSDGDTAKWMMDVLAIDSTDRVFTLQLGSDFVKWEDQTGSGGGGWLKDSLQAGDVSISAAGNDLSITGMGKVSFLGDTMYIGELGTRIIYPSLLYQEYNNTTSYIGANRTYQIRSANTLQSYPFFSISEGSGYMNVNSILVDTFGLIKFGLNDDTPLDGNGYLGYADADSTIAIYYNSAWHPLAWRDEVSGGGLQTASNGLTAVGSNVKLGGTLSESTTISGANNRTFDLDNMITITADANTINLESNQVNIGDAFSVITLPDATNTVDGSEVIKIEASEKVWLKTETAPLSVILDSTLSTTTINGAFRVDDKGFFKPQEKNNYTPTASQFGYIAYSIADTTLFMWDGSAWNEIGDGGGGGGGTSAFYDPYDQSDTLTQNITVKGGDYTLDFDSLETLQITDYGNNIGLRILNDVAFPSKPIHSLITAGNGADSLRLIQEGQSTDTTKFIFQINTSTEIETDNLEIETDNTNLDIGQKEWPGLLMDNGSFSVANDAATYVTVFRGSGTGTSTFALTRGDGSSSIPINEDEFIGFVGNCNIIATSPGTSSTEEGDHNMMTFRGFGKNVGGTTSGAWTVIFGSAILYDGDMSDATLFLTFDDTNDEIDFAARGAQTAGSGNMVTHCTCRVEFNFLNW
jgi:hypothetical protein